MKVQGPRVRIWTVGKTTDHRESPGPPSCFIFLRSINTFSLKTIRTLSVVGWNVKGVAFGRVSPFDDSTRRPYERVKVDVIPHIPAFRVLGMPFFGEIAIGTNGRFPSHRTVVSVQVFT